MKTVAIVGMAKTSRGLAPFWRDDIDEVWTLNHAPTLGGGWNNWDRLFEMHPEWSWRLDSTPERADYLDLLQSDHGNKVIYTLENHDDLPNARRYPLNRVMSRLMVPYHRIRLDRSEYKQDEWYATSSFCYMVALAIFEEFDRIEIYGFEMASSTEWAYQKPAGEFWLGYAGGRGINVVIPEDNTLLRGWRYGYDMTHGIHRQFLESRKSAFEEAYHKWRDEMNEAGGRRAHMEEIMESLLEKGDIQALRGAWKRYKKLLNDESMKIGRANVLNGMYSDTVQLLQQIDAFGTYDPDKEEVLKEK